MAMRDDLTFHGYTFGSVQDVELAKSEWQKIEYLESKMPFQDAEKMRGIVPYTKRVRWGHSSSPSAVQNDIEILYMYP